MDNDLEKLGRGLQESLKKILRDYAEALFFAILLALILRSFVLASYKVTSDAMSPSLIPGDFILGFKLPYGIKLPFVSSTLGVARIRIGELAVFSCENSGRVSSCIKRVVGLSGDRIEVLAGRLHRNGELLKDFNMTDAQFPALIVPPGHAFVVSDQWGEELDSFTMGPIPLQQFEARAEIIWFSKPPGHLGVQWERLGQRIR